MSMIVTLDVRPMLAKGQEPFAAIMQAADALGPDQTLRLIAPFRPVPLIGVLRQRGFPLPSTLWAATCGRSISVRPPVRCRREARSRPRTGLPPCSFWT